jgi:hypothetical protein
MSAWLALHVDGAGVDDGFYVDGVHCTAACFGCSVWWQCLLADLVAVGSVVVHAQLYLLGLISRQCLLVPIVGWSPTLCCDLVRPVVRLSPGGAFPVHPLLWRCVAEWVQLQRMLGVNGCGYNRHGMGHADGGLVLCCGCRHQLGHAVQQE